MGITQWGRAYKSLSNAEHAVESSKTKVSILWIEKVNPLAHAGGKNSKPSSTDHTSLAAIGRTLLRVPPCLIAEIYGRVLSLGLPHAWIIEKIMVEPFHKVYQQRVSRPANSRKEFHPFSSTSILIFLKCDIKWADPLSPLQQPGFILPKTLALPWLVLADSRNTSIMGIQSG